MTQNTQNSTTPIDFAREAALRRFLDAHAKGMHQALCTVTAVRTVFAAAEMAVMAEKMVHEIETADISDPDPEFARSAHYETLLKSYREAVDAAYAVTQRLFFFEGHRFSELGQLIRWARQWDRAVSRLEIERQADPEAMPYDRVRASADRRFEARARVVAHVLTFMTEPEPETEDA
jgi:hypothetical protein